MAPEDDKDSEEDLFEICIAEFILHEIRRASRQGYEDKNRRPGGHGRPPRGPKTGR